MGRDVGFGDKKTYNDSKRGERLPRYTAEMGRRDIIRIVSTCIAHKMHWLHDRKRYAECGFDDDGAGACLVCAEKDEQGEPKYPVQEKYGALVIHIATRTGDKWEPVNEIKYWGFGGDKYRQLFEFNDEFGDLRKLELLVTCSDTKLQKLNFNQWTKDSMLDAAKVGPQADNAKKWLKIYTSPSDTKRQLWALGREDDAEDAAGLPAALTGDDSAGDGDEFGEAGVDPIADVESLIDDIGAI